VGDSLARVLVLLRARLSAGARGGQPIATMFGLGFIAAVSCGLVRDLLPPFPYALFSLTLCAGLLAIPLLGDLGWLLREDEAREWVEALPVRGWELRMARTLHLLIELWALAAGMLASAALLAPANVGWAWRLGLALAGCATVTSLASLLLLVHAALGGQAEAFLVLLQTAIVVGVVVGTITGLGFVPELAQLQDVRAASWLACFPPAWFASALDGSPAPAMITTVLALLILLLAPTPRALVRGGGETWIERLLGPARALAVRTWVRRDERGPFALVYDALPREREVVLRTYPMIGIPLAFLLAASGAGAPQGRRGDLLALLLFTAGIYLPILLVHVPTSSSHAARWILDGAPIPRGAIVCATIKALALRFLVPLFVLLAGLCVARGGWELALRLALPGALVALLVLRGLHGLCVHAPPLSTSPDRLEADLDWLGVLGTLAVGLTIVALLANRLVTSAPLGVGLALALLAVDVVLDRRTRARLG
jgi:hypothetical protein